MQCSKQLETVGGLQQQNGVELRANCGDAEFGQNATFQKTGALLGLVIQGGFDSFQFSRSYFHLEKKVHSEPQAFAAKEWRR